MPLIDPDSAIEIVPDLAVEVLSRKTEARDRGRKMILLGRHGLPEYWLVDPSGQRLEIYTNTAGRLEFDREHKGKSQVCSPTLTGLSFPVARLFTNPASR